MQFKRSVNETQSQASKNAAVNNNHTARLNQFACEQILMAFFLPNIMHVFHKFHFKPSIYVLFDSPNPNSVFKVFYLLDLSSLLNKL